MKVHIIHAHSESDSFVTAMKDVMVEEFEKSGAAVGVSDLYGMGFNPVASPDDFRRRGRPDHLVYALEQRYNYDAGSLSPDIQQEVEQVLGADLLCFTFPVYWFSVPAILKGWIDRVFLSGPFYGGRRLYGGGGLVGKRAFAAISLGGRSHMFGPAAVHGELESGMMRHFFQGTLGYVGLTVHQPFVAYHVPYLDDAARADLLLDLRLSVRELDRRPTMAMPDLSQFDDRLAPKAGAA